MLIVHTTKPSGICGAATTTFPRLGSLKAETAALVNQMQYRLDTQELTPEQSARINDRIGRALEVYARAHVRVVLTLNPINPTDR